MSAVMATPFISATLEQLAQVLFCYRGWTKLTIKSDQKPAHTVICRNLAIVSYFSIQLYYSYPKTHRSRNLNDFPIREMTLQACKYFL